MARTSFYDDNKFRRYPFLSTAAIESAPEATQQIPDSVLLACGFTMFAYSGYIASGHVAGHVTWLNRVSYDSENLLLEFACTAPGLEDVPLNFTVPRNAGESTIVFAEAYGDGANPVAGGCTDQLLWAGFIVVGNTEDFVEWAPSTPLTLIMDQHVIEPALIRNLDNAYVRSVNLANQRRVRTTDVPGEPRPYLVNAQCMQGPMRFVEGKNCSITYDLTNNGLVFAAGVGDGDGEPCAELPVVVDEEPPEGSSLLSGGPKCSETIKTINGVGGPRVIIRGSNMISVLRDQTDPHKINVTIDASFLANQGG